MINTKGKEGKKIFSKWDHEEDEQKHQNFVPDSDSEDNDFQINVNSCHKCDVMFDEDEPNVYGCDYCPWWFHKWCLPAAVLVIAEAEGKNLADIDVNCDYCSY